MTDIAVLNHAEQVALDECERVIEAGVKTFVAVGSALAFVRDNNLYRGTHPTFEVYARERWNISRPRAYELMTAADVVSAIADTGQAAPENEGQARALAAVPEPERADVWRETVERTEGKPTAAAVRAVRNERTQTPGPSDKAPPVDPGTTLEPEPMPQPVVPPPGSPASWTPEQVEANRLAVETKRMRESAIRHAKTIANTIWVEVSTVTAGVELGERGLVTAEMVAQIRDSVEFLAKFVEVEA